MPDIKHNLQDETAGAQTAEHTGKIILSHQSALAYYRLARIGLLPMPHACDACGLDHATVRLDCLTQRDLEFLSVSTADLASRYIYVEADVQKALKQLGRGRGEAALATATDTPHTFSLLSGADVLVGKAACRNTAEDIRVHRCGVELPEGSVRRISDHLYIVSPELMYAQMAHALKKPHLAAALATELAGTYALLPAGLVSCDRLLLRGKGPFDSAGNLRGDGYCDATPLTTVADVRQFLRKVKNLRGSEAALNGLKASVDGSASPFETAIDVSLALPRRWGGAGCGLPQANKDVPLNADGKGITGKSKAVADALFTSKHGKRIDVEPAGREWHSGKDAMTRDNERRLALERQKIEVIVVSWENFEDPHTWSLICNRIACHLGKNFHAPPKASVDLWRDVHNDFCNTDRLRMPL